MITSLLVYLSISFAHSHSWVECADYQADFDGQNYNFDDCHGFTRDYYTLPQAGSFSSQSSKSAGGGNQFECPQLFRSGADIEDHYDDEYPYATYVPGGTYRLVWPAKNHGIGDECGSSTTFDAAMAVYVNPNRNPTSDLTSVDQATLIWDWHAEYLEANGLDADGWISWRGVDGVPFANCEDYCADTDASPCWGDITIPTDLFTESGFYTFIWYWEFSTLFISCYEAYVDVDGSVTNTVGGTTGGGASSGDSSDSEEEEEQNLVTTWHAKVPLYYTGAAYDETLLVNTLNELFENLDDVEWEITSSYQNSDDSYWNVTAETYTTSIVPVSQRTNNGTLCEAIEEAFVDGDCTVLLGGYAVNQYSVTSLNDGSGKKNNGDATTNVIIAVVVVLAIILVIVGAGIGYQKMQEKQNVEKDHNTAIQSSTVAPANSNQQIVQTNDQNEGERTRV